MELRGVVNRRPESTAKAAAELDIPQTYETWQQLIEDPQIDAVVIGVWPYLHCPITLAALAAGKHVLTEARMAMNAAEARQMYAAAQAHPELVTQIVPSPIGIDVLKFVNRMLADGYLGELRETVVLGTNDAAIDPAAPLHWRQSAEYSGLNSLALGILHEALIRWTPDPIRVLAQSAIFTQERPDPATGKPATVGTPDSLHLLTQYPGGAQGIYHLSSVARFGPAPQIHLYGTEGTLKYHFGNPSQLLGGRAGKERLVELRVPHSKLGHWRVEADFIDAIRGVGPIELTDFATGVRYMEFTEAVAASAKAGAAVEVDYSIG